MSRQPQSGWSDQLTNRACSVLPSFPPTSQTKNPAVFSWILVETPGIGGAGAPPTSPRSVLAIADALAARRWREVRYAEQTRF